MKSEQATSWRWVPAILSVVFVVACHRSEPARVVLSASLPAPIVPVDVEPPDPELIPAALDIGTGPIEELDCTACHTAFITFPVIHGALFDRGCVECHEPIATAHPVRGAREFVLTTGDAGVCLGCHPQIGTGAILHTPLADERGCLSCHRPHVSEHSKLLKHDQVRQNCFECHELEFVSKPHQPVLDGDCTGCHDPHSSDHGALTRLDPRQELCLSCHVELAPLLASPTVHEPLRNDCSACHRAHGSDHPALLPGPVASVCVSCHAEIGAKTLLAHRHAPVEDCSRCHAPHGDQANHLLKATPGALCAECHETISNSDARYRHAPLDTDQACASCHDPHGTAVAGLLPQDQESVCLSCHEELAAKLAAGSHHHEPIRLGACTACHDPHQSDDEKLLKLAHPKRVKTAYARTEYALCFACHDPELVESVSTATATRFRDGDRNLHHVHVVEKGRTCGACHEVHAGTGPGLIRTELPFGSGGWRMPIEFVAREDGGTCLLSCHAERGYRR